MKRLHKTPLDYMVIALSPALIMTLVGSLLLFLIQVFYQGEYEGRLEYVFVLFVIGIVLISRISIEDGRERAVWFAVPMAVAILLAVHKFVEFQGPLAAWSWLINVGLIAVVWWSADKLTWDCTLIDEQQEDTGEGLLETVGLDRSDKAAVRAEVGWVERSEAHQPSRQTDGGPRSARPTLPAPADRTDADARSQPSTRWQRFVARRRRPHPPGVWVVYFSLAALPLFGVGQCFISKTDPAARRYAFELLWVYTASGLGLLLSTSFLGLRRYLRQRQLEMPTAMVPLWLGVGGVLLVGVLLAALLLPRPNAEFAISEPPLRVGSPDRGYKPSPHALGRDGIEQDQAENKKISPEGKEETPGDKKGASNQGKEASDKQETSKSEGSKASGKEQRTGKDRNSGEKGKPDKQGKPPQDGGKTAEHRDGTPSNKGNQETPEKNRPEEKDKPPEDQKSGGAQRQPESAPQRPSGGHRGPEEPTREPMLRPELFREVGNLIPTLGKWLLYLVFGMLAVYALWKNRGALLGGLARLIQQLLDLWRSLFHWRRSEPDVEEEQAAAQTARRRFADFADPFASGTALRWPPAELVRYTFEAVEAWGHDNGLPRGPEQTPHEFARDLAVRVAPLTDEVRRLADLYCQAAYAGSRVSAAAAMRLGPLWRQLRETSLGVPAENTAVAR
jgi:hypothetical protein